MATYIVGSGEQSIQLDVDITTLGLAATRAIVIELSASTPGTSVATSSNATGDIPRIHIGTADELKGKRLSVLTKIDLISGDVHANELESQRLTGSYLLDGGAEGVKTFESPQKAVSSDFSTVVLFQIIDLTVS